MFGTRLARLVLVMSFRPPAPLWIQPFRISEEVWDNAIPIHLASLA